jgi:O-antigen/teichoic acid export membrane protein
MFASIKRLTKNSAIYGIGHIFSRSIAFFLLPIYTNFLSPNDFGIAVILLSSLAILNIFYVFGMDSAFLRHFITAENESEKRNFFHTALTSILAAALIFSTVGYVFSESIAEIILSDARSSQLIKICSGILLLDGIAVIPYLNLRAEEKSLIFVSLKSIVSLLTLLLNWLFIMQWAWGINGIFWANLIASSASIVLILPFITKNLGFRISLSTLKQLLHFGLPYVPSTLAVILMDVIDRFFLERMIGKSIVGLYGAGYRLGMFMALFVAAFRFAWHPFFLSIAKQDDAKRIFSKVFTYFLFACAVVYLLISYFIDDLIQIQIGAHYLFGEAYWESTAIVPIVMLAYIFYGAYVHFVVGIHLEKKTKYLPFITGAGATVNIIGNLVLIPSFGMLGAAWATVLSYFVMAAVLYFVSQHLYTLRYEFARVGKLAFVVGVYMFLLLNYQLGLAMKGLVYLSFPISLAVAGFFHKQEILLLKRKIRRKFAATPPK